LKLQRIEVEVRSRCFEVVTAVGHGRLLPQPIELGEDVHLIADVDAFDGRWRFQAGSGFGVELDLDDLGVLSQSPHVRRFSGDLGNLCIREWLRSFFFDRIYRLDNFGGDRFDVLRLRAGRGPVRRRPSLRQRIRGCRYSFRRCLVLLVTGSLRGGAGERFGGYRGCRPRRLDRPGARRTDFTLLGGCLRGGHPRL